MKQIGTTDGYTNREQQEESSSQEKENLSSTF